MTRDANANDVQPEGRGFKTGSRVRAVFDPTGVATARVAWTPTTKQERVLAPDEGIDVIVGGLGSGKSDVGALKLLRWALRYPRRKDGGPSKWLILGPDFSLLRDEQMQKVLDHAARLKELGYGSIVKRVCYGQNPSIYLCHDQELLCRSGTEPRRMRGHQFEGMWQDEAEWQPERAFTLALSRMRSARAIRSVVTTSPQTVRNSWVWPLLSGTHDGYNALRQKVAVRVHRWRSKDNPANEPEVIDAISAALEAGSPGTSAQELDGLFLGTHEAPELGVFDYERAFVGKIQLNEADTRAAVMGVDLGKQRDFTWITVLSRTGVVLYMERCNASTVNSPRDHFYVWAENRVVRLVEEWRVPLVKLDDAMQGQVFADSLRKKLDSRARVEGIPTNQQRRKAQAIESLGVMLSRLQIRIPDVWIAPNGVEHRVEHVFQLKREFSELRTEDHDGYRSFRPVAGAHDDGVVSLALAAHGFSVPSSGGALNFKQPHFPKFYGYGSTTPFGPFGPYFG